MKRRRFLALCGGAAAGIWIEGSGFLRLERDMIWKLGGFCSFCDKAAGNVFALAGIAERSVAICDECAFLCLQISGEDAVAIHTPDVWTAPDDFDALVDASKPDFANSQELVEKALRAGSGFQANALNCSFCDRNQKDVARLMSGRNVFICDVCLGDSASILLRRKMAG